MLPEEEEWEATEGEGGGSGTYFIYFILLCLSFSGRSGEGGAQMTSGYREALRVSVGLGLDGGKYKDTAASRATCSRINKLDAG